MKKPNLIVLIAAFIAFSCMLSSCSKSSGTDVEYLAVKLSDSKTNWSIIKLSTGEVIAREDFKNEPSVICDDMFYVQNDKGEYEFYNINDINKQIGDSYEHATYFQNGRAIVSKKDEPLMVINTDGEKVKKLGESVKTATPFKNGFARIANEDHKCGFIDTEGNIVIKMEYDVAADFSEDGYVVVGKKNEDNMTYSVINAKGDKMFSFNSDKYSNVRTGFVGGSMAVVKDDKIVYLDSEGKQMMKVGDDKGKDDAYGIYNGLTIYANDEGSFGVKNAKGEVVIKAKYEGIIPNRDGTFLAQKDGKCTIINGEGQQISKDEYKDIIRINPDRFIVKDGNSYSIIDKEGKEIGTETFSDYSYEFDDSPALSDAREVSFSTDSGSGASLFVEPTGDSEEDAQSIKRAVIEIMNSVQGPDDAASMERALNELQEKFDSYYKAKGSEAYNEYQEALKALENDYEIKQAQMQLMNRLTDTSSQTATAPEASAAPEYTDYASHEYIESMIPTLTSTRLTEYDIAKYDSRTLRLLRNAIFATHNYKFQSEDLQEFFGYYDWYTPVYANVVNQLSAIEKANIQFIKSHE